MRSALSTRWAFWLLTLSGTLSPSGLAAQQQEADFVLREALGQRWRNECVWFELTSRQQQHTKAGHTLIDSDGQAIPYQLEPTVSGSQRIAFAADLDPFDQRSYRFFDSKSADKRTDLKIVERAEFVELTNSVTGISLRQKSKPGEGPIDGIRLASGGWIGGSRLRTAQPAVEHSLEVTARGPVFSEAMYRAKFGEQQTWEMKFRVYAHEPVVVIEETFSTGDDAAFLLALGADYSPDRLFYRAGNNVVGKNATWNIDANDKQPVFVLEPWLHWWERDRQGNWFGLYSSTGSNLVALGALGPSVWIDPAMPPEKRSASQIFVTQADNDLWASFPLRGGRRKWLIATLDQDLALELPPPPSSGRGPGVSKFATLPQKHLIKHGDFPLDRVKDVTSSWGDKATDRIRPLVNEATLKEFRRRLRPDPDLLARFRRSPVVEYSMDEPIAYYLATHDAELGRHLAGEAVRLMQIEVDNYYQQNNSPTLGA